MKCIIVEGPQGCGKTSLTNYLRDNIAASNLYRLTGNKDKTITGKEKSRKMYYALLNYMKEIENSDVNIIFDRTFFTEQVYALLGYKDYDFTDVYEELLKKFNELNYEVYYISLYLKDVNIFETRLKREHHNYQAFSLENSTNQQKAYQSLIPEIKKLKNTKVYELAMDDFNLAYQEINKILGINKGE
ncbi:MAG: hypothetical protein OSJ63_07430 [Bacilli bacterium]|jgi:thymidylate kinase|nr:hypothetical protein [Bacilli bacterium]